MLTQLVLCLAAFWATGCSGAVYQTRFTGVTWDDANWRIQTTVLDQGHYQSRASIANGYIGINVAALGPFFEVDQKVNGDNINGWPLFDRRQTFATVGGFYDVQPKTSGTNFAWLDVLGGESVISGVPHWAGLIVEYNGNVLNASTPAAQITGFTSTLDLGAGHKTWQYTWTPPGGPALAVEYTLLAHKLYVNQAVTQLKITSPAAARVLVSDVLDGDCAVRTFFVGNGYESSSPTIWTAVQPWNIPYSTAYIYSTLAGDSSVDMSSRHRLRRGGFVGRNVSSIAQAVDVNLAAGTTSTIEKYIGIASTDAFADPQGVASGASSAAATAGFAMMLQQQTKEWNSILTRASVDSFHLPNGSLPSDPNIIDHQVLAVSNPYALLQNTVGANAVAAANNNPNLQVNSISVGGLASDSYAGFIFWDAEVWMAPGLAVAFPDAAIQIANYRREKFPMARKNIDEAYTAPLGNTTFAPSAAIFPWTSGRFGNCTGTGPCFTYEYHINGDIGLELQNHYFVTGDSAQFRRDYFPMYDAIAQVYSDLIFFNHSTGTWMLNNATDPDEYANMINNPGYTMVLMKTHLEQANTFRKQFGLKPRGLWTQQAKNMEIPVYKPAHIILEYTGMNGSIVVKQADVVLVDDFLGYPNPYTLSDLDYYAGRQTLNGPGMTYGVFSVVAAAASPSGCSQYTYDLYGSQPYARAPWFQFSEQLLDNYNLNGGTHPAFPFLTGMGGANRVAVFGYLGLKLKGDSLNINPTLPPQIPNLRYRKIYWQGYAIHAEANQTHTTLKRLAESLPHANPAYKTNSIPVTIGLTNKAYELSASGAPLTLANRRPSLVKTVPGNIAQCQPVTSNQGYEPGQFPLSAVDGAVSTKWQPLHGAAHSAMTVDLGAGGSQPIRGFAFDWAQAPPKSYVVTFSNSSNPHGKHRMATSNHHVKISNPYNPMTAAKILPYMSNTTNVTLPAPVWGGRYVTLTIQGNQEGGTTAGATVAEFAVVGMDGTPVMRRYYSDSD